MLDAWMLRVICACFSWEGMLTTCNCVKLQFTFLISVVHFLLIGQPPFHRKHPLSTWLSSMLMCFAGSIIANLLLGEPVITPFKDHKSVLTATAVW